MKQPRNIKDIFFYIQACKQVKLCVNNVIYCTYVVPEKIINKMFSYKHLRIDLIKYYRYIIYQVHNYYIISDELYEVLKYGKKKTIN